MDEPLMHCRHCGERIGVYEPLIVLLDGSPRETSRAAEPGLAIRDGESYHRECWERRRGHGTGLE